MSTPDNARRILAQQIADALMTAGDNRGTKAERLALKKGWNTGKEVELGGWCREAAIDRIEKVLKEQNKP